jgi:septum formation protein
MQPLILGSQSERRKEILSYFSLPFVQIPSHFDEAKIEFLGDPKQYAMTLSSKKADTLAEQFQDRLILTADTVVFFKEKIYNKPTSKEHAHAMVKSLAGHWHTVVTAVTVRQSNVIVTDCEETRILLQPLTDAQINVYHSCCHFLDKAGGYAIQKGGSMIVSQIEGCYYNVMGLPVGLIRTLLLGFGIDLWDYLNPF